MHTHAVDPYKMHGRGWFLDFLFSFAFPYINQVTWKEFFCSLDLSLSSKASLAPLIFSYQDEFSIREISGQRAC